MTTKEKQAFRQTRVRDAMQSLVGDERFKVFMDEVGEQQKVAMLDAVTDTVISNERRLSVALGEIRAYQGMLDIYHSFAEQGEVED